MIGLGSLLVSGLAVLVLTSSRRPRSSCRSRRVLVERLEFSGPLARLSILGPFLDSSLPALARSRPSTSPRRSHHTDTAVGVDGILSSGAQAERASYGISD